MTPNQEKFISSVKQTAKENNIEVIFIDKTNFQDEKNGVRYVGYFDSDARVLAVTTKKSFRKWFQVFIHETCHMDQFLENDPVWDITIKGKFQKYTPIDIYEMYIDKVVSLTKEQQKEVLGKTIAVELDCEHRAIQKIDNLDLGVNREKYIQAANLCLYDYVYAFQNRLWYHTKRLQKKDILEHLPTELYPNVEDYFTIPKPIKQLFDREILVDIPK